MTSIAFCEKQLNMNKNSLRLKQLHAWSLRTWVAA
jgi:hypothetical protein